MKYKTSLDVLGLYISILVLGTFILDKIIMLIARPYVLTYLNSLINENSKVGNAPEKITYLALGTYYYYIAVFHLLVIITALIVFLNKKYRIYRRELLFAYLIIVVADIVILFINYWIRLEHIH